VTRLELIAVEGLPEVRPGDDLAELISSRFRLEAGDVLIVAQKVVSKSEGRLVSLSSVTATDEAKRIASKLIASPDQRKRRPCFLPCRPRSRQLWTTAFYDGLYRGELQAIDWPSIDV